VRTRGAVGEYTADEALTQILSGTGLTYRYLDEKTVTIVPVASTKTQVEGQGGSTSSDQEGKKSSSEGFRLAQVDQGQPSSPTTVEKPEEQTSKRKPIQLEEVVVTGSRIPLTAKEGAQDVKTYTRQQIEQSGQTNVAYFLNTLPEVSVSVTENNPFITGGATTTVQLRGLPIGTTLVLLNGRRVGDDRADTRVWRRLRSQYHPACRRRAYRGNSSRFIGGLRFGCDRWRREYHTEEEVQWFGSQCQIQRCVRRTEPVGRRFCLGFGIGIKVHSPSSAASKIAMHSPGAHVRTQPMPITKRFGGPDRRSTTCNPGTVFSANGQPLPGLGTATFAAVPAGFTGQPTIQEFQATAGTRNLCNPNNAGGNIINESHRAGVFVQGNYDLTSSVNLFTELLYSHTKIDLTSAAPRLFSSQFTVSSSNPSIHLVRRYESLIRSPVREQFCYPPIPPFSGRFSACAAVSLTHGNGRLPAGVPEIARQSHRPTVSSAAAPPPFSRTLSIHQTLRRR